MRKSFETSGASNNTEQENSDLGRLWRKYNLFGEPLKPGTPVEARLREKCRAYSDLILGGRVSDANGGSTRRQMHNEICIMVLGKAHADLSSATVEKIADFACELTTGMTAAGYLEYVEQFK